MSESPAVVALVTAPPEDARRLACAVVERRLAACVNIVPLVSSIYRWEGEVRSDDEALLVVKTLSSSVQALEAFLREAHPYETFELVVLPVLGGSKPYLDWIAAEVRPQ